MSRGDYSDPSCSVFVGNLDKRVTEEIMWDLFLQAGPLERVNIPKDKETGVQRSFGFVEFANPVSVTYASQLLDGLRLYGQNITVKPANNKSSTPNQASNMSSPLTFNSDFSRNSPVPLLQGMTIGNLTPFGNNSQRQGQNGNGWHQHGGYSSPQFGGLLPPPSLMQQHYQSRIHHERRY